MRQAMGAALFLGLLVVAGCRTTQPQGQGEDVVAPSDSPVMGQEPIQTVPNEPPGPAEPMPLTDAGVTDE